jgi:hypothetical protein
MALRNLRHCRIIDPDRHDDPELLFIAPPTPPRISPRIDTPAYLDTLRWLFIAMALIGAGITIYARWDDWRRGKR